MTPATPVQGRTIGSPFMSAHELRAFSALAVFRYRRQGQQIAQ